jgi:hypothetical protein
MKKIIILFSLLIIPLLSSCDDQVNPKADFEEVFVLNCIIRADTNYQVATISRSYNVEGFDPLSNRVDPFIKGAVVKIIYDNVTYVLKDSSVARTDTSRYNTPLHFYYTKNFKPEYSLPIKIEARLPNGKILTAASEAISINTVYLSSLNQSIPSSFGNANVSFNWGQLQDPSVTQGIYYAPELVILYSQEKNGVVKNYQKKIPITYISGQNGKIPIYPQIQSGIFYISFYMDAINLAMQEISDGDPNKSSYKIDKALFRLLLMDAGLATYYAIQKTFFDEFSLRVNQPEVSNIKGGLGVFGFFAMKQLSIDILPGYIESFGYKSK